jgi:hypothetical protein
MFQSLSKGTPGHRIRQERITIMVEVVNEELLKTYENTYLPKWTNVVIKGMPCSKEYALEVIRRIDLGVVDQLRIGLDKDYGDKLNSILKFTPIPELEQFNMIQFSKENHEKWGYIVLDEHLATNWISPYRGVGHGFIHPDGSIIDARNWKNFEFNENFLDSLKKITLEFPELDFYMVVFDDEIDNYSRKPVMNIRIHDKCITAYEDVNELLAIYEPSCSVATLKTTNTSSKLIRSLLTSVNFNRKFDPMITLEQVQIWADKYLGVKNESNIR